MRVLNRAHLLESCCYEFTEQRTEILNRKFERETKTSSHDSLPSFASEFDTFKSLHLQIRLSKAAPPHATQLTYRTAPSGPSSDELQGFTVEPPRTHHQIIRHAYHAAITTPAGDLSRHR
ncbi:unnamed protein product [Vicia faba]|uniref:Uncharacterized protein n=1 Tax=Vicia faba TaxID=3906 RepID=A0AAV1B123_VICFA|nr:unnamed protein product [Vicia faba]